MSYLVPRSYWSWPSLLDDMNDDWGFMSNTPSGLSVAEDDKSVFVEAAVPGVKAEDIDITFEKGMLRILAESKKEEKEGRKYFRRSQSSFSYQMSIPNDVDVNTDPQTHYEDGVLTITFAKSAKAQPKKIAVQSK